MNYLRCDLFTDSDGDRVVISTDEELTDALDQFDGSVFKLHVKSKRYNARFSNIDFNDLIFSLPRTFSPSGIQLEAILPLSPENVGCSSPV